MRLVNADNPIEFLPLKQRDVIRQHQDGAYVELAPIFRALGIEVEFKDMPDTFSGEISYAEGASPSGFVVRINNRHTRVRQRFTAAHELGHCLLHGEVIKQNARHDPLLGALHREMEPSYCPLLNDHIADPFADRTEQEQEIEANRFAAALIMPAPILNKLWRGGVRNHQLMARKLGVSLDALRRRLKDLSGSTS